MTGYPGERHDLRCPEPDCGALMELRPSRFGLFYGCARFPLCRSTHGAHPDGRPLGIPATGETKRARIRAHAAFDRLWELKRYKAGERKRRRGRAYVWLARALGVREIHMGELSIESCNRVVEVCEAVTADDVQSPRKSGIAERNY